MNGHDGVFAKCARRLIPLMVVLYIVNFLDRVNVGFAALAMNKDLAFIFSTLSHGYCHPYAAAILRGSP